MDKLLQVPCGEWIYPCRESSCGVQYPIDETLVAEIFPREGESGIKVSDSRLIDKHLKGPRFLEMKITSGNVLKIYSLMNKAEEFFKKRLAITIPFDKNTLARATTLFVPGAVEGDPLARPNHMRELEWNAILFTSIILQAHLNGVKLPKEIIFRKATIPEIESLGRW